MGSGRDDGMVVLGERWDAGWYAAEGGRSYIIGSSSFVARVSDGRSDERNLIVVDLFCHNDKDQRVTKS